MECIGHRGTHATWRLHIFQQLFSSTPQSHRPVNRSISTSRARLSQAQDEALSKTPPIPSTNDNSESISPSQRLPQSPVITHPRSGVPKIRKPRPEPEDKSDLKKNPWALALASPIRMCVVTGTRMPRRLMGVFGLVNRPETAQNYLLPLDLINDSIQKRPFEGQSSTPEPEPETAVAPSGNVSPLVARDKEHSQRPILHMLTLRPLVRGVTPHLANKVGKRPGVAKLIPYRWKYPVGPLSANDLKDCVWRHDMPDFLLRQMRRDIVKKLARTSQEQEVEDDIVWKSLELGSSSDSAISVALGEIEPVEHEACGAVILFTPHAIEQSPFSETILHPRTQTRIPVFDLSRLLSEDELKVLAEKSSKHFQGGGLFFRPNGARQNTNLLLYLWKLQRFLADNTT